MDTLAAFIWGIAHLCLLQAGASEWSIFRHRHGVVNKEYSWTSFFFAHVFRGSPLFVV
jgi:hypothetical protein